MRDHVAISAAQYRLLRERLLTVEPDLDDQTLADTLEGITDLHEIIGSIVRFALDDEALAAGLKGRLEVMHGRLDRLQDRAAKRRQLARDVMVENEIKKIAAADFTISVRPGSPGLVVTEESSIPAQFWEPRDPRLNRQALLAELKHGAEVPGVGLSNPEPVLSVRTK